MITQFIHRENESPRKGRPKISGLRAGALSASALLLTLGASIAGAQQTVSVDFVGGGGGQNPSPMAPTETAGVIPVANWNQATGNNGTASALVDSTGTATPFAVTWKSPNTWANGLAETPGNVRLLKGYLDTGGNGSAPANTSFTVSGLNAANTYSIYVYATGGNTGRSGIYSIGSQTFYLQDNGIADGSSFVQATSTTAATPTVANYIIFTIAGQTTFTVTSTPDASGGGGFRSPINGFQIIQVLQPPAAPTGLAAVAGDSTVSLTWNAVSGAATYNVLRGAKAGGPYTTVATGVVSPTYTDTTGLTNNTTYFYVVQAVNKNGTSANSNEVSVTPLAANIGNGTVSVNFVGGNGTVIPTPLAPTDVAGVVPAAHWNNGANAGGTLSALTDSAGTATSAAVTWSGSPNTWAAGIGEATPDYKLMEGYLDSGNTTVTSVNLSGLSPTKVYLIYVYAARDNNDSAALYSLGNTTYALKPNIFAGAYIPGTSTDPANPTLGNYVTFQVTGQSSYTVSATPDVTAAGYRSPINGVQFVVLTAPTAPANLTAAGLDSTVYLNWTVAPLATSYNVLRSATAGGPYTQIATGVTGATYTDAGLTNGKTYYYVVQAVNLIGTSPNSNQASATPLAAVIGTGNGLYGQYYTPGTADFSAETTGTLVLTNVVPTVNFNAGNAYTTYNPQPWPAGLPTTQFTAVWSGQVLAPYTGPYQFQTISDDGARLTVNGVIQFDDETGHGPQANTGAVINLTAGTKYNITFEYVQGTGGETAQLLYSPLGAPFQIIPQSQLFTNFTSAPSAPTNLIAVGHNKSVQLYWTGGLNTAAFNVKRSLTAGGPYTTVASVATPFYLDSGLTNGVTYYYIVTATNNLGESSPTNEASALTTGAFNPIAYWRFEEGTAGAAVAPNTPLPDSTGKGNTLQTPDPNAAPTYAASVFGAPTNPTATNLLSLDFSAAPGLNSATGANFAARYLDTTAATGDINSHVFNQFTIEASFNLNALGTTQTIVGKDGFGFLGDPNLANATLYFQVTTANVLSIRGHNSGQTFVICDGVTPLTTGHWYNGAAVSDGYYVSLYLQSAPGGPYHLENIVPFTGMLFDGQGLPFSVGRGFYNDVQTDRYNGLIDEVRISDTALDPSLFLFAAPSGPTITGRVSLEGVPDLSAVSPSSPLGTFTVTFRTAGTGTVVKTVNVTLGATAGSANGTFSVSGVPAGTYDVIIKGAKNLAVLSPNVVVSASGGTIPLVMLPAGDSNNDNFVDSSDFGTLIGAFNTDGSIPGSGYDPTVDFNFDGLVDSSDFGLLIGEFNNSGAM